MTVMQDCRAEIVVFVLGGCYVEEVERLQTIDETGVSEN